MSGGKYLLWILINSESSRCDCKKKSLISRVMNRDPLWLSEMTLFMSNFASKRDAAGELVSPKYSKTSPPTTVFCIVLVLMVCSHNFLSFGAWEYGINSKVSLPMMFLIHCDKRPNSFDKAGCHTFGLIFSNLFKDNFFPWVSKYGEGFVKYYSLNMLSSKSLVWWCRRWLHDVSFP